MEGGVYVNVTIIFLVFKTHSFTYIPYKKDGVIMAEDEEECFDEYKLKGLVSKSANLICQSPIHNIESPSIWSLAFNFTAWNINNHYLEYYNFTIIPSGIIVQILATYCDGLPECWNGIDEENCGSTMFKTVSIGKNSQFQPL